MRDWIVGSEEKLKDGESRYKEQPLLAASKEEASHPVSPPPRAKCRPWRGHGWGSVHVAVGLHQQILLETKGKLLMTWLLTTAL